MRRKALKCLVVMALFTAIAVLGIFSAYADSFPIPDPEILESKDGSRVFVFNPYGDENYPIMGVYSNTEPLELIYPISFEQMVFVNNLYFSADMCYLVFAPEVNQSIALEFYSNGDLIKMYWISNLVEDMNRVSYSISMAFWENRSKREFDIVNNTLAVTTVDNLSYLFDVTTGEAIEGKILSGTGGSVSGSDGRVFIFDPEDIDQNSIPILGSDGQVIILGPEHLDESSIPIVARPLDIPLIIGIGTMLLCAAGIVTGLIIYKRGK